VTPKRWLDTWRVRAYVSCPRPGWEGVRDNALVTPATPASLALPARRELSRVLVRSPRIIKYGGADRRDAHRRQTGYRLRGSSPRCVVLTCGGRYFRSRIPRNCRKVGRATAKSGSSLGLPSTRPVSLYQLPPDNCFPCACRRSGKIEATPPTILVSMLH
jgi:hypothetical protein